MVEKEGDLFFGSPSLCAFDAVGSEAQFYLLNDAGPPMNDEYLKPCFQQWIRRGGAGRF